MIIDSVLLFPFALLTATGEGCDVGRGMGEREARGGEGSSEQTDYVGVDIAPPPPSPLPPTHRGNVSSRQRASHTADTQRPILV